MLRTLILLVTHLSMLFAGAGLALITVRARRQAVLADRAALDVRATFLETTIERQLRIRADAANPAGRHRAPSRRVLPRETPPLRPRVPSPLTATLTEATAILATQRAKRIQEHREFVDLMTTLVGPAKIRTIAIGHQYADVRVGVA